VKSRDVAILGAVVAIAVVAAVDAVRGDGRVAGETLLPPPPQPAPRGQVDATTPTVLVPVEAPGSLVFTDARDCRVRVVRVASAAERDLPRLTGDCALWAPPVGPRIAYGLDNQGPDSLATAPFRLVDLRRPGENLGGYRALFGFVVWSRDGRRVAWCGESRAGYDLELGGTARRLDDCPSAFTPDGRISFAQEGRVVVDGETVLEVDGGVTFVRWSADGSLAVVVDGERLERWVDGRRRGALDLPRRLEGRVPELSPDNCAALFAGPERIELLDLGCFGGRGSEPLSFAGTTAAWSPDGRWIAVAEQETIAFHRVEGRPEVIRWLAAANEIAWQA
jgi:hypothetical protein